LSVRLEELPPLGPIAIGTIIASTSANTNGPKYIIASILLIIPSALFGYLLKGVLITILPISVVVIICSILVTIFIYLLFKVFGLFNLKDFLT
jgi:hypothetical protein